MEVKLDKRYPVAASPQQAWAVLADVHATAACMPGAQITEQIDATHFKGSVKSKVGPAVMQFGGDIEVLALDATSKTLQLLGKGADKAGSSAQMNLTARVEPGDSASSSVLVGQATIVVSGKLAQFGSRLLVPVSDALLAQFADNFRAAAAAVLAAASAAPASASPKSPAAEPAGAVAPADETDYSSMGTTQLMIHAGQQPGQPHAAGTTPAAPLAAKPVKELNALALMWAVFKGWLAGLFGVKRS